LCFGWSLTVQIVVSSEQIAERAVRRLGIFVRVEEAAIQARLE
jgi:hypothetical protein